ncbi:hypothetical protein [Solidesulfovibrio magneticus]|uniref:Uncharacterized protein n=1 Tax=Solidesulfovibrio magneticus (strain ATCC 700980 / DSM 13731 / RS-1) TaxID=573370 RepID=C4XM48_SOLM1|nr:hypothetical protein [Solidesulfovibrio magneticus]BAH77176.1 hypothetical protein DMR_36850 [Solidesulfovibrio magneticus RS-1]
MSIDSNSGDENQSQTQNIFDILNRNIQNGPSEQSKEMVSQEKPAISTYPMAEFIDSMLESNKNNSKTKKSEPFEQINQIMNQYELFRDYYSSPCATRIVNNVKKTYYIEDSFENVLHADFIYNFNEPAADSMIKKAIKLMKYYANENPDPRKTYKRFAYHEGSIYLDLNDGKGSVVKADKNGWEVLVNPPIEFIRTGNMQSLPIPIQNGSYDDFFKLLNFKRESDLILTKAYIPCIPNTEIPRPALFLVGMKGSSKSTTARLIRRLIDPVINEVLFPKNNERDMNLIFQQHPLPVFDNVQSYDERQCNFLCMAITGGGMEERKLHTNGETFYTHYKKPFISTSINVPIVAKDLVDRSIIVELEKINPEDRKDEEEIFAEFANNHASYLGGLLGVIVQALKIKPSIALEAKPRMADFARMACAAGESMGVSSSDILHCYNRNKFVFYSSEYEDDRLLLLLIKFLESVGGFEGTVTELLGKLNQFVELNHKDDVDIIPKRANALSRKLKEYDEQLTLVSWNMQFSESARTARLITFKKIEMN